MPVNIEAWLTWSAMAIGPPLVILILGYFISPVLRKYIISLMLRKNREATQFLEDPGKLIE